MDSTELIYGYKMMTPWKQLPDSFKFKGSELSDTQWHVEKLMTIW